MVYSFFLMRVERSCCITASLDNFWFCVRVSESHADGQLLVRGIVNIDD
ncbi:hypothetical protein I3843_09G070700 [Carya illinoinensis]|nr:hypothetical protein I3843_09G070700 [Carya illinoinensis]